LLNIRFGSRVADEVPVFAPWAGRNFFLAWKQIFAALRAFFYFSLTRYKGNNISLRFPNACARKFYFLEI
jgi:hypothetical protein